MKPSSLFETVECVNFCVATTVIIPSASALKVACRLG